MQTDLLQAYRRSVRHPLSDEDTVMIESYLEKMPWFALPHYISAKRDSSPINLLNARTYAPVQDLLKTYLGVYALPEPKEVLQVAPSPQKPISEPKAEGPLPKNDLFAIVDFSLAEQTAVYDSDSHMSILGRGDKEGIDQFLNTEIMVRTCKYVSLIQNIRLQISEQLGADQTVESTDTAVIKTPVKEAAPKELKQEFVEVQPAESVSVKLEDIEAPAVESDVPAIVNEEEVLPESYEFETELDESGKSFFLNDKVLYMKDDRIVEIPVSSEQYVQYFDKEKTSNRPGDLSERQLEAQGIIDRFLKSSQLKKVNPLTPEEKGGEGDGVDDEFISETLAELHLRQGNPEQAIRMYKKLGLIFPKKSSYFDARIKEIIES